MARKKLSAAERRKRERERNEAKKQRRAERGEKRMTLTVRHDHEHVVRAIMQQLREIETTEQDLIDLHDARTTSRPELSLGKTHVVFIKAVNNLTGRDDIDMIIEI